MPRLLATALAAAASATCWAGDQEPARLRIGDTAPAIDVAHWLRGEPVTAFESGKIYVVEFWATWCGPCKASIPHVSELQERLADYGVTLIGISDEPLSKVVEFVATTDTKAQKLWYDQIRYTLATDPDRSVFDAYMKGAGMNGIPTAFIVGKDGRIEWIGHPTYPKGDLDRTLDAIIADSWDREKYSMISDLRAELRVAEREGAHDKVLTISDRLVEIDPAGAVRYKDTKFRTLLNLDRAPEAYAIGRELVDAWWEEPQLLNSFAWFIADDEGVKTRDLALAMKAATRASELTNHKDAAILDTVARVYYEQGDLKAAIRWQEKAVDNAPKTKLGDQIRETLEKYRKEQGR
jgi:thiol-disulfide isomerase/thioredoxin